MASLQHVRENRFNWYVRLATTLVAISVLGVTAASASGFADINCSIPARIAYQIAAVRVLSLYSDSFNQLHPCHSYLFQCLESSRFSSCLISRRDDHSTDTQP